MDYKLYYWDIPFRGNFALLPMVEKGLKFEIIDASEIYPESGLSIVCPGIAPPYLYDCQTENYLNQMPAIMMYLGSKHKLLPKESKSKWEALKIILDCNDILYEITRYHGSKMWSKEDWEKFKTERFPLWLKQFEKLGSVGLDRTSGCFFEGKISVADLAVTALLGAIKWSFPELATYMKEHAPNVLRLVDRVEKRDRIKQFLKAQRKELGKAYCSGEIEDSLRTVIGA